MIAFSRVYSLSTGASCAAIVTGRRTVNVLPRPSPLLDAVTSYAAALDAEAL
jgi:hypothetical protein